MHETGAFGRDRAGRYAEEEEEGDTNASIFVKYNRVLHGQERKKGRKSKNERLTVKFLKKYIHYAKNMNQPTLNDEVPICSSFFFSFWLRACLPMNQETLYFL